MATPTIVNLTGSWPDSKGYVTVAWPAITLDGIGYAAKTTHHPLDDDGNVSIPVFATDDAGVNPEGAYYQISQRAGSSRISFKITVPAGGGDIDLNNVIPVEIDPPGFVWIPSSGSGSDSWVNFGLPQFGGRAVAPDGSEGHFDNTTPLQEAYNYAIANGMAGVAAPWVLPGKVFEINGRPDAKSTDFKGNHQLNTVFKCMTSGAGMDFTAIGSVGGGQYCGHTSGFGVDGNNIALRPFVVGRRVSSSFGNIRVLNSDPNLANDGVNILLSTTQNCKFDDIVSISGKCTIRFDIGAFNNAFYKGEFAGGSWTNVEFRQTGASPLGHFSYPGYNSFTDTVIEGTLSTTKYMIYSSAGALNVFRHTPISVNGSIIGGTLPTAMDYAVYCDTTQSVQSSLIFDDCKYTGGNSAVVGFGTANSTARIQMRGGSFGAGDFGVQGNVVLETGGWWFGTLTVKGLFGGNVFTDPRREQAFPTLHAVDVNSRLIEYVYVPGEAQPRIQRFGNGNIRLSDGTNPYDIEHGRIAAKAWGLNGAVGFITGRGTTAQRPVYSAGQAISAYYFDTSLGAHGKPIWWNGTDWRDATDTAV